MPTFSHSKINTFRQCPRKYYYQYVNKPDLPKKPNQVFLFLGSICHDTLERLYEQVRDGRVPTRKDTLAFFDAHWDQEWTDAVEIHDERSPGDYKLMSRGYVERYYDQYHPFDQELTIDTERRIDFALDGGDGISMMGYIDRLSKSPDGTWHIHDYKSSKSLPTQAEMDEDPQLAYYEIGIRTMWPDIERVELHWHYLKFGQTITSRRTPEQLEQLRADALGTIHDALGRGKDENRYETVESGLCRYCDFKSVCPVTRHEFRVNGLARNEYLGEPGVGLVNTWGELNEERKRIKADLDRVEGQIESVKEALIHVADDEGISTVSGDEHLVSVKHETKVQLPSKSRDLEAHAQLERVLRESSHWDTVSGIDAPALRTLLKAPETMPADLARILERFTREEETTRVTLRKRK